ncbi:MAG: hypothetical protein J5511_05165 [Bacilli bacterium]|nr:hypothetical protein [Bacilli bacterium]
MFKYLGLLLLSSLIAVPAAVNNIPTDSFDATHITNVRRDGEGEGEGQGEGEGEEESQYLHGYTYTDVGEGNVRRVFDAKDLAPTIDKLFCAPMGYVFKLSIDDRQVQEIADQIEFVDGSQLDYMNIAYFYGIYGTAVYSDSNSKWYEGNEDDSDEQKKEWFKSALKADANDRELTKVEEVITPADLYVRMEIQVSVRPEGQEYSDFWVFVFYSETLDINPYNEFDFVSARLRYYQRDEEEKRVNVDAMLIDGFFNDYSSLDEKYAYNPYGWLTDTTTPYPYALTPRPDGSEHYFCDYTLTLVAFDTVTIGTFDRSMGIEMSYPTSPIRAKLKLVFVANGETHTFYSRDFIIGDPNVRMAVDGPQDRKSVQKNTEHLYTIIFDNIEIDTIDGIMLSVDGMIDRLMPDNEYVFYCYDAESDSDLPEVGVDGAYYYIPSAREKALHEEGKDKEFLDDLSEGEYYIYNQDPDGDPETEDGCMQFTQSVNFVTVSHERFLFDPDTFETTDLGEIQPEEWESILNHTLTFPFTGRFSCFRFQMRAEFDNGGYAYIANDQPELFEIIPPIETNNKIVLDVEDEVVLFDGGDEIVVTPSITDLEEGTEVYYNFKVNKEGHIDVTQDLDGKVTIRPLKSGLVTLTFEADSTEFSKITKTITVRVLDGIYDNAAIEVKDTFHKVGVDLEASLSIRGFNNIKNVDIAWKVVNKKGEELPAESIEVKENATMVLKNPESGDYTITASYEGIEIAKLTVQVRYLDVNKFLRANIWWIMVLTLGLVFLMIFFATITKRGKTTVDRIERVYAVYCQCIANDSLSMEELKRIKHEITRCLHHCEDLNIDAFNQYEKATRYLRKSLGDTKMLMKNYDALSVDEKAVMYERLNADLGKALNVAKEIENAKGLIEQYHMNANRKNFETLAEDKKSKKDKKKDETNR